MYDILNPSHYVIMSYQHLNKEICYQCFLIVKTIINIFWCFFQYITCLPRCQCMFWNHIFCPPFVEDYTKPRTMLLDLEIGLWMRIKIHNEVIEFYVSNVREFLLFPILTSPSLRSCYRLSKVSRCANVKCVKRWILMANSFQSTEKKTCYNTVSVPNQF